MKRRTLLAAIGTGAVTLQAGCLVGGRDGPGDGSADGDGNGDGDGSDDRDVQPAVVDHTIETTGTDCMTGEDGHANVDFDDEAVSIEGLATAPTPCHEATIESATVDAGELTVRLALAETDDMCTECVGAIEYAATIDLENASGLDTVTVEHGDDGETYTATRGG